MVSELAHQSIALATVCGVKGSVPRELGARMLVCADGRLIGTIGGGAGEAKVYQRAIQVLQTGDPELVEVDLSGAAQRETQGVCGGKMQVWVDCWQPKRLSLVQQMLEILRSGQPSPTGEGFALITPLTPERDPYLLTHTADQFQVTDLGLIAPLRSPPLLLIVGAGHVAVPLAQVAHLAGFQIAVVDDRPEYVTSDRFPHARYLIADSVATAIATLPPTSRYIALVTRGMQHDLTALQVLLPNHWDYIGMIGSRKRVQLVLQTLSDRGYDPNVCAKIHAPIGLDIGAFTPEEIAISICAELIKIRRGGTGNPLSNLNGTIHHATNH